MKLLDFKKSKLDLTKKYIFDLRDQEVEFSYIHKNDGKDIIVCPCQTSCKMGCTFCFLTGMDLPVVNLTADDICAGIKKVITEAGLPESPELLLSFMGSGEPLLNYKHIIRACQEISKEAQSQIGYRTLRFAIATMLPSIPLMKEFTQAAKLLNFKVHLSLHSPFDGPRRQMMPNAARVEESIEALRDYKTITKNAVEIHYTLIDGVNDREEDQQALIRLLDQDTPIKFLDFKARPESEMKRSSKLGQFSSSLSAAGIPVEIYAPPGSDIGSSCGQFIRNRALPVLT